jgi:hypothetical protein
MNVQAELEYGFFAQANSKIIGTTGNVLEVHGDNGLLFSVDNNMTGIVHTIRDISGIPVFTVDTAGIVTVAGSLVADQIDLNTSLASDPDWVEGRVFWDAVNKCVAVYDDESEVTLQVGQEVRIRVYNANGSTLVNGAAVSVTGLNGDIVEVELADASDKTSALNTIGIATHDIEPSSYGWVTTTGFINGVDTTTLNNGGALTEGAAIYLSETVPGAYQETRPLSPSYEVRMGGVAKAGALGKLYAELRIITNIQDNTSFLNGAVLEPNNVSIVANGTTVNCALNSLAANNKLSLLFDQDYVSVADGININLTPGTDAVPVENWVYIDNQGAMQIDLVSFPSGIPFTPVARVLVPSLLTAQAEGVYKTHAYTDHLTGSNGQGHLSHINSWIRKRPASYLSGCALSQLDGGVPLAEGTSATRIDLKYTVGVISQLHDHAFPEYDTTTRSAFVVNDFATPYEIADGITEAIDTDSENGAIGNNKFYILVVWGVVSEETKDCKLFFNLPSGSYTSEANALNDTDETANYLIPPEYLGTGFLMTKFVIKRTTTTVQVVVGGTKSLLGLLPGTGGGSTIGGGGITAFDELGDTPSSKSGQSLKLLRVNVGETALEYVDPSVLGGVGTGTINRMAYYDSTTTITSSNWEHNNNSIFQTHKGGIYLPGAGSGLTNGSTDDAELSLESATAARSARLSAASLSDSGTEPLLILDSFWVNVGTPSTPVSRDLLSFRKHNVEYTKVDVNGDWNFQGNDLSNITTIGGNGDIATFTIEHADTDGTTLISGGLNESGAYVQLYGSTQGGAPGQLSLHSYGVGDILFSNEGTILTTISSAGDWDFKGNDIKAGHIAYQTKRSRKTADYTIVEADNGSIIEMNATGKTITFPATAMPDGWTVQIVLLETGSVTITKGTTPKVYSEVQAAGTGNHLLETKFSGCTVYSDGTDFFAIGKLT